jgi:hypothetical protein
MGPCFESESDNVDSRRNLNGLNGLNPQAHVACRCGEKAAEGVDVLIDAVTTTRR